MLRPFLAALVVLFALAALVLAYPGAAPMLGFEPG